MHETIVTRETAVARLRRKLIDMQEEGKSVCRIAAEKGLFCRGFHRDTDDELRFRYAATIDQGMDGGRRCHGPSAFVTIAASTGAAELPKFDRK